MLTRYLDDLESRIAPEVEEDLLSEWKTFLDAKRSGGIFSPRRRRAAPTATEWPDIRVNQAIDSFEHMVLQQLASCSDVLAKGTGAFMNVRANYGTGILPSIFGAEVFRMEDVYNTLPTTRPLAGGTDAIRRFLDRGAPDLAAGYGRQCFFMARHFADLFSGYPRIAKYVHIYHPDLQGPMDVCELLLGSAMFVSLIDEPDLMRDVLRLITQTYLRFMREWERIVPPRDDYSAHWGLLLKGRIMIRDDSAMNLSPEMFDQFIQPYDQQVLSECGGGAIHFCGRGDHYIDRFPQMSGLTAVNLSQPQCNDMERIFRNTVDKGIALIGLQRDAAEDALNRGRNLHGLVHCW